MFSRAADAVEFTTAQFHGSRRLIAKQHVELRQEDLREPV
jgi:hypothetical protein